MKAPLPCEFSRSVEIAAPAGQVYAFHENPYNIRFISPAWQVVQVLEGGEKARVGEGFEIQVRFLGWLPLKWRGVWLRTEPPGLLVDEALSSPFAYWQHHHRFEPIAEGKTLMTDHVSYLFPGGWLGKWFGETLGRIQFHFMFVDRQKRTARWFLQAGSA